MQKEKFKKLDISSKKRIFNIMLEKLWAKLDELYKNKIKNKKRILIYEILIKKIQEIELNKN
jgi:hypothetical protein